MHLIIVNGGKGVLARDNILKINKKSSCSKYYVQDCLARNLNRNDLIVEKTGPWILGCCCVTKALGNQILNRNDLIVEKRELGFLDAAM